MVHRYVCTYVVNRSGTSYSECIRFRPRGKDQRNSRAVEVFVSGMQTHGYMSN